ncbi:MAG: DUF3137 domain-containing protein [Lachnospiraceae bacterium]|nr:DUF3137 domain-containing protein [Lachnospiraceae bacterium]
MDEQMNELLELAKKIRRNDRICLLLTFGGIALTVALLGSGYFFIGIILVIAALIMNGVCSHKIGRKYRELYKTTLVNRVAAEFFQNFEYLPDTGYEKNDLRSLEIMQFGSDYNSEDTIRGTYNGVPFTRADVYIADTSTDSEGNTTTTEYFKGQWLMITSNKDFHSDLQIIQKGFGFTKRKKGFFTRKEERRHVFETEDVSFNKRFQCLCQNDAEAFYLLTPGLMQSLMQLSETLPYKMMVAYVQNQIHVLIDTHRDSMEPSKPKNGNFDRQLADIRQDMEIITRSISGLLVDRNLYRA